MVSMTRRLRRPGARALLTRAACSRLREPSHPSLARAPRGRRVAAGHPLSPGRPARNFGKALNILPVGSQVVEAQSTAPLPQCNVARNGGSGKVEDPRTTDREPSLASARVASTGSRRSGAVPDSAWPNMAEADHPDAARDARGRRKDAEGGHRRGDPHPDRQAQRMALGSPPCRALVGGPDRRRRARRDRSRPRSSRSSRAA